MHAGARVQEAALPSQTRPPPPPPTHPPTAAQVLTVETVLKLCYAAERHFDYRTHHEMLMGEAYEVGVAAVRQMFFVCCPVLLCLPACLCAALCCACCFSPTTSIPPRNPDGGGIRGVGGLLCVVAEYVFSNCCSAKLFLHACVVHITSPRLPVGRLAGGGWRLCLAHAP